jgi:tRNA A37 methylthiotransferase MiaB
MSSEIRASFSVSSMFTARRRDDLIGTTVRVLVDEPGVARSHREAPEIDGVIEVSHSLRVGEFAEVRIVDAMGPDLVGEVVAEGGEHAR